MSVVSELVANVLTEATFDASEEQALGWISRRHELMCTRSKCFRERIDIGPTIAGQRAYTVPPRVLEIHEVLVQSGAGTEGLGVPYGAGRHIDLAEGALGYIWLGGLFLAVGGGLFVRDTDGAGSELLAVYPTPTEAGLSITLYCVSRPEPLTLAPSALLAGTKGTLRFFFGTRELTAAERATFNSTGVLPAGVGTETGMSEFNAEWRQGGNEWATIAPTKVATGSFRIEVPLASSGTVEWRGEGKQAGALVAATGVLEAPVGDGSSPVKVPPEYYDALVAGAVATGLTRIESRADLAGPYEATFAAACVELEGVVNRRYKGKGPAEVRVVGINA